MLLTRLPLSLRYAANSARLACVMHSASVNSEPGSNSPLNGLDVFPALRTQVLPFYPKWSELTFKLFLVSAASASHSGRLRDETHQLYLSALAPFASLRILMEDRAPIRCQTRFSKSEIYPRGLPQLREAFSGKLLCRPLDFTS